VLKAPQNVLRAVRTPTEVAGVPSAEVLVPIVEQRFVLRVGCSPAACYRVADKVDIDLPLSFLLEQLLVDEL
jgi:hypothetical protein